MENIQEIGGKNQRSFDEFYSKHCNVVFSVSSGAYGIIDYKKSTLMSVFIFRFMVALGENLFQKSSLELSKAF